MTHDPASTAALASLIRKALAHGIEQVRAAGSPLHPLLFDDSDRMLILFDPEQQVDPMELALRAIRSEVPNTRHAVLVLDTRITQPDGRRWDAIVAMGCIRGSNAGEVWAQRYVPKGWFRAFRSEGSPEPVAESKDFISAAFQDPAA